MVEIMTTGRWCNPYQKMRLLIKILLGLIFFSFLTVVTPVGGNVFLISILTFGLIDKRLNRMWPGQP